MLLPRHFLPRPPAALTPETVRSFDVLLEQALRSPGAEIPYSLGAPKWQFLCHVCDTQPILAHGSGNPDIAEFEGRKSNDVNEFGNRKAVYAASDGLWAMYFALVDRTRVHSLLNSCMRIVEADGVLSAPYYFFSVEAAALAQHPWRTGTVYLLPRATFEQQAREAYPSFTLESAQWASLVPVRPLAKLTVEPDDFPFLSKVYPHDPEVVYARAAKDPGGFPWLDDVGVL